MLRVDAVLVLERDVYPLIPKEHLQLPAKLSQNPATPQYLSPQGCNLSIVGHDRGECLLVYYKGFSKDQLVPYVAEYNTKTASLRKLWAPHGLHNLLLNCTTCCVNEDRTLLGFDGMGRGREANTAPSPQSPGGSKSPEEEGPEIDIFESYIAEVTDDEGACYSLMNRRTPSPQHVHFLQGQGKGSSSFVYIYYNQSGRKFMAELFSIYTVKHSSGVVKVTAKPHFKFRICNRLYWYDWDHRQEYLYLLERRKTGDHTAVIAAKKNPCLLTCYMFQDRKPVLNARYPVDIAAHINHTGLVEDYLRVVRFHTDDNNPANQAMVLCQQHGCAPGARSIAITLFVFHHDVQIDFAIPFPESVPTDVIARTRVCFEVMGSRLLIYVPGHYLQLLDCGLERPPHLGLVLTGPDFATQIRGYEADQVPFLDPLEIRKPLAHSSRGHLMVDRKQGVVFEFSFNHDRIPKMLEARDSDLAQQALWSACNTGDHELIGQVVLQMCSKAPLLINSEFFKEYLLGAPHEEFTKELRKKTKPSSEKASSGSSSSGSSIEHSVYLKLSNMLPSTASESLILDGVRRIREIEFRMSPLGLKTAAAPRLAVESKKKNNSAISMSSLDCSAPMDDVIPSPSVFRRLVTNVNRWFGLPDAPQAGPVEEEAWFDSVKQQVVGALCKHMQEHLSKDSKVTKSDCYQWATDFRALQGKYAYQLYQLILQGSQEHDDSTLFHLLSHYYSALEELMLPIPKTFHDKFSATGYRCLPRQVFLQYLERQIFTLSPDFVLQALSTPQPYEDDEYFRYQLLNAIPEPNALEIMRKLQMDEDYLVEHMLSYEQDKNYNVDMENVEDAEFLPLGVYLEALQSKHLFSDDDHSLIASVERAAFLKALKLNSIPL